MLVPMAKRSRNTGGKQSRVKDPGLRQISRKEWIAALALGLVLCGFASTLLIGFIVNPLHGYWRTREKAWAPARVESALWSKRTKRPKDRLSLNYTYEVGGVRFTGDRVALFKRNTGVFRVGEPRPGDSVRVYIDSGHPGYSVIDREFVIWPFWGAVVLVIGFGGMGSHLLCWVVRNRFRSRDGVSRGLESQKA